MWLMAITLAAIDRQRHGGAHRRQIWGSHTAAAEIEWSLE
jgi:hypothetical protein